MTEENFIISSDSTCDLYSDYVAEHGIRIVPLHSPLFIMLWNRDIVNCCFNFVPSLVSVAKIHNFLFTKEKSPAGVNQQGFHHFGDSVLQ